MNISGAVAVGIGSILVLVVIQLLAFAVGWGRMVARFDATDQRIGRMEHAIGIADGETVFMRRTECTVLDAATAEERKRIETHLTNTDAIVADHERRIGHIERDMIGT